MDTRVDVDLDRAARAAARRLRHTLLAQLGLASPLLAGCAGVEPDSNDEGGVTTNPSSSSASSTAEVTSVTSVDSGEGESGLMDEGEDSGPKLDISFKLDVPPDPQPCWNEWFFSEAEVTELYPDCSFTLPDGVEFSEYVEICVDKPAEGCAAICDAEGYCEGMDDCMWSMAYDSCGVFEGVDSCCSVFAVEPLPPVGRPFVVDAAPRLAELDESPAGPERGEALGLAAAHWLETARGEHASIAAFARFVASLQRVGAPASLVAEALRAAADEVRHTADALALASTFAGRPLELGPLRVDGAIAAEETLAEVVEATLVEGCIGETLAAHEAASLAALAEDPEVGAVLERIAADEARHAALAWRFVAWALGEQPSLRARVRSILAREREGEALQRASMPRSLGVGRLGLGCPPPGLRARWRAAAVHAVVDPCAAALLAR